jgi:hypothetical protein
VGIAITFYLDQIMSEKTTTAPTTAEKTPTRPEKGRATQKIMKITKAGNLVYFLPDAKELKIMEGIIRRDHQHLDLQVKAAIEFPCWLILGKVYASPLKGYFRSAIIVAASDLELITQMVRP